MAQRRFQYEQAFEHYLRANRIPYVAVDEARKALMPARRGGSSLKSFDFVVYHETGNLLVDVKGRRCRLQKGATGELRPGRLESWVTRDDVESLGRWQGLFGEGFRAVFVFLYRCDAQPPDALFQEVFPYGDRWYVLRAADLEAYRRVMRPRSEKWGTVHVGARDFERISEPFRLHRNEPVAGELGAGVGRFLY